MRRLALLLIPILWLGMLGPAWATCCGQPDEAASPAATDARLNSSAANGESPVRFGSRIAVGLRVSLLGIGGEVATPITRRTNVRVGFNAFNYSRGYDHDGIHYAGELNFRSVETHFDWFPFAGSFHLSPGLMIYNGNQLTANATAPAGQSFSLGNASYISDPASPITGKGRVEFTKVAPTILMGWGNLLPRSGRHFAVPFEFGVVFQGTPQSSLQLQGGACDAGLVNCRNVATDAIIQSNIQAEQKKMDDNLKAFKYYPVVSMGLAFNF